MAVADRIPFLARRTLVAVPARFGAFDAVLLVDTGAERLVISGRVASRLGLNLAQPVRMEPLIGVGQTYVVPVVRLQQVQVGASAVSNLLASVYDLPASFQVDGILGLSYLNRFRVTLEFDTRTLVLRLPPTRRLRQPSGRP